MLGRPLAERVRAQVAADVAGLGQIGLATIQVGEDEASTIYLARKHEAAADVEIAAVDRKLHHDTSEEELLAEIAGLNANDEIDGILVQLPLPRHIDEDRVIAAIEPVKDVDGLHPFNAGHLFLGRPTLVPATPLGVMALLEEHKIQLEGARAVVVGRSALVGKPVSQLLLRANATVSVCHTRTDDLERYTLDADVLVVAAGRPEFVTADMVKSGSAVVDVGINRTENGIVGDVDPDAAAHAAFITPVPGGVGPMTIAMLLQNTVRAARYRRRIVPFP
jgi:methylenetetrahydrofolate dehydrogenase (NADP+)/methenyltetrahydrofolate cyclohydrolase